MARGRSVGQMIGGRLSFPGIISAAGGGSTTTVPEKGVSAADLAGLGRGAYNGAKGYIWNGVGSAIDPEEFTYNDDGAGNRLWVGQKKLVMSGADQTYLQIPNQLAFAFLSTGTAGAVGGFGTSPRLVENADAMFAKGFKLQQKVFVIVFGNSAPGAGVVQTFWYNYNDGDNVALDADGSASFAKNPADIQSAAGGASQIKRTDWVDLVTFGGAAIAAAAKKNLMCRPYGHVTALGATGGAIDFTVFARWIGRAA